MTGIRNANSFSSSVIAAESNHRIANNLMTVATFLGQQSYRLTQREDAIPSAEVRRILCEASLRVAAAGELHRLLIASVGEYVDLADYLNTIAKYAVKSLADPGLVNLSVNAQNCRVDGDAALRLGLIVSELIVNAIKYAHPAHNVVTRIELGCHRQDDGSTLISVADDGIGFPEGFDPECDGNVGIETIRMIAQEAGAALHFDDTGVGVIARLNYRGPATRQIAPSVSRSVHGTSPGLRHIASSPECKGGERT